MTKSEMSALSIGDRLIRTRDDGLEEAGTVTEKSVAYLWVEFDAGHPDQPGIIEIADNARIRREDR